MLEHIDLVIEINEMQGDGHLVCLHRYRCTCAPAAGDQVYVRGVPYLVIARTWEPQELTTRVLVGVRRVA